MQDTIMLARLVVGGATRMGGDAPPGQYQKPGLCISIHVETAEEAERIYRELEPGGEVVMPIQETFWAVRFGMVTDRFGIPWMLNCEKPMG
jgi:PhnB protein